MTETTHSDLTLDQFDAQLNDHAGEAVGFADTVRRLRAVRANLTAGETRRKELREVVAAAHDAGAGRTNKWRVAVFTGPTRPKPGVPSAVLKKHNPRLWDRARVLTPWVTVTAPPTADPVDRELWLPPEPGRGSLDPVFDGLSRLSAGMADFRREENELKDRLRDIAHDNGWNGLPIVMADRWTVGLTTLRYSSDALRELDPETFDRLAVTPEQVTRLRIVPVSREDTYAPDAEEVGHDEW